MSKEYSGVFICPQTTVLHPRRVFLRQDTRQMMECGFLCGAMSKSHVALYGNSPLQRIYCEECSGWTFVINGLKVCCDKRVSEKATQMVRISTTGDVRKRPSGKQAEKILSEQKYRCIYCGVRFGEVIKREFESVAVELNWDHLLPYSYSQNNKATNFVASCQICNGIKSDMVFETLWDAQKYISEVRKKKGYVI